MLNKIFNLLFFLIFCSSPLVAESIVNLSLPPEKRWVEIVNLFFEDDLREYAAMIDQSLSNAGLEDQWVREQLMNYGWSRSLKGDLKWFLELREEVKGIAKALKNRMGGETLKGFAEEDLFLLNMGYDFSTNCTTGVYKSERGPILFRNLDWEGEAFKHFVIETHFVKGDKLVFKSIQFLGQVGVLTGMKPYGYALALNYRKMPGATDSKMDIIQGLFTDGWCCSFYLRYILEHETDFKDAQRKLERTELMAPCYLTMAGMEQYEGAVIERGRNSFHTRFFSSVYENPKFLVQTNHDVPNNPEQGVDWAGEDLLLNESMGMGTIARREAAVEFLKEVGNDNIEGKLMELLTICEPVHNPLTIFSSVLSPHSNKIKFVTDSNRSRLPGTILLDCRLDPFK